MRCETRRSRLCESEHLCELGVEEVWAESRMRLMASQCWDGVLLEHWDVIQDEATEAPKSGLPMFGERFGG
jgi:predicted SnoaL-like aldol condensation-catalyzing enzyme